MFFQMLIVYIPYNVFLLLHLARVQNHSRFLFLFFSLIFVIRKAFPPLHNDRVFKIYLVRDYYCTHEPRPILR